MAPINPAHLHPSHEPRFAHFASRRSTVFSAKGAVATSQSLGELRNYTYSSQLVWLKLTSTACQAGIEILNKGGNAGALPPLHEHLRDRHACSGAKLTRIADAAVATAAAMNVSEPCSTGALMATSKLSHPRAQLTR
jgi:gamma-glutamyltranspeptidase/glutathione hydrolase